MNRNIMLHIDHIIRHDTNDTIVLIEGIGAGLSGWDMFIDALGTDSSILRYDHPCAGRSRLIQPGNVTDKDFLEMLEYVLQMTQGNIHIVGYSLGGFLAFRYLTSYNSCVDIQKRIKSISIGAGFDYFHNDLLCGLASSKNDLAKQDARTCHIKSLPYLYDDDSLTDNNFHNFLISRCQNDPCFISSDNFMRQIDACLASEEWKFPSPSSVMSNVPLLLMYAGDDRIVKPDWTLAIKKYFSKSTVHAFSRGGHCFKDVHKEAFSQFVTDHISRNR